MRQYQYNRHHESAYELSIREAPSMPLGPEEVRLWVHASSLNYRDLIMLRNSAGRNVQGIVPLSDGAGEIVEIGSEVTQWKVGDRVVGCFFQRWLFGRFDLEHHRFDLGGTLPGMLSDTAVLSQDGLVRVPAHLSYEEAACLPCAAVTAWHALVTRGGFQAGDSVLLLGTGGVSIFALQLANALGARIFVTSSSDQKLQRAKLMGAEATVNYRTHPEWHKEVWNLTEQRGVDHVIEVGGPGTINQSMQCVAAGGHIALIGVLTGMGPAPITLFPLLARNVRLNGIYVGPRMAFEELNQFLHQQRIHPVIDRVFRFENAPDAFDYLAEAKHFGKVVITHG